ncbi:MAG TPA: class I SAM-dependent methyltransferase [Gaiellaceae bacterium]|nr:class I SAM-dependent methyltransferase [Gaiellaceae bacterium]
MRWVAKALLQKGLSGLPQPERANYLLQRHVTRSLPVSEQGFRRLFRRAVQHLDAYEAHGPGRPASEAVFYEFGAGWDLAVPLSLWSLGVERQVVVDLRPNVRLPLVTASLARLRAIRAEGGRELRDPGRASVESPAELEQRFGIQYLAPRDARATGLPAGSLDFVSSTSTLEHVPAEELLPLLAECRRLLRPDGAISCRIDLSDHFSHFDSAVGPYDFLRYGERTWRLVNSRLLYQNRLRRPDYLRAFAQAGLTVTAEQAWRPKDPRLPDDLAPRFRAYGADDLAVQKLRLVARPSPDALEEREHVIG